MRHEGGNIMKELKKYYRKQKTLGALLVVLSIFTIFLGDGDATWAIIGVPLGTYCIFTKEMILENDVKDKIEREARS